MTAPITRVKLYNAYAELVIEVDSDQVKLHEKKIQLVKEAMEARKRGDTATEIAIAGKIINLNKRIRKNVTFPAKV